MLGIEWEVVGEEIEIEVEDQGGYTLGWLDENDLQIMLEALRREKDKNANTN